MDLPSGLDWDDGNLTKCQKHGVSIEEIEEVLSDDPFLVPDHSHSLNERRFIAVGANRGGRLIFVIFTLRVSGNSELVRPVSARYMHRKEIEKYGKLWRQESSNNDN